MAEAFIAAAEEAASRVTQTAAPGHAAAAGSSVLDRYTGDLSSLGAALPRHLGPDRPGSGRAARPRPWERPARLGPDPSRAHRCTLTGWFLCGFYDILASITAGRALLPRPAVVDGHAHGGPHTYIPAWSRGRRSVRQSVPAAPWSATMVLSCMDRPPVLRDSRKVTIRTHA